MIDVRTLAAANRRRDWARYRVATDVARRACGRTTAAFAGSAHATQVTRHAVAELNELLIDAGLDAEVERMWTGG
jgi:hypothetical protein